MGILRTLFIVLATLLPLSAAASFHTFRLQQFYTNADGSIQFIVLKESSGFNGQNLLSGHTLKATQGATTHTLTFAQDLPSSSTANRFILVATPGFAALGIVAPDYTIPAGFLFATDATVDFAGVDMSSYVALPTDGLNALDRNGIVIQNLATNFAGASGTVVPPPPTVPVIEYHHAAFDHYFITPVPAEIALLDARAPPFEDWSRTGFSFNAYVNATAPVASVAICRFFNSSFAPKSSHFYAAKGFGCEDTLALFPDWRLEDDKLFNEQLPAADGTCPAGTVPVYRLYNRGMGGAPNHRFVTSLAERQKMIDQNFVPEGNGIGVGMCAPA